MKLIDVINDLEKQYPNTSHYEIMYRCFGDIDGNKVDLLDGYAAVNKFKNSWQLDSFCDEYSLDDTIDRFDIEQDKNIIWVIVYYKATFI